MTAGLDADTLEMTLDAIVQFADRHLPDEKLIEFDEQDICPEDIVRQMCSPDDLGVQLAFLAEEYNGFGGSTFDTYRICEKMAHIDLGLATTVFATFLGSDPISFGATEEQKRIYLTKIADEGAIYAYGATEPEAGSDLGALKTTAKPVMEDGEVKGYLINGRKQWISNGGIADWYTILANTPGGPSWFIVERDVDGFVKNKPENKHGIRLSNTAALFLDDVYVPADRLVGLVEGQGLIQAQLVFGLTRLMVAAFGLGGGWAALDRAIPYSQERIQAGGPLSEKQGYTHKLIVPHVVRLEGARAYLERTAERIDEGEGSLNTEGAIAKYLATEGGNAAAEAGIQALGGYGYTKEFMVEKVKRDVRITCIYEGTSEIMEMTIARDRWQLHLKSRGAHFHDAAASLERTHGANPNVGAGTAALASHALAEILEWCRVHHLTRNQHILFRLGELIAYAETAGVFAEKAAAAAEGKLHAKVDKRFDEFGLATLSRIFARDAAMKIGEEGLRWVRGAMDGSDESGIAQLEAALRLPEIQRAQAGLIDDMDTAADVIYGRTS